MFVCLLIAKHAGQMEELAHLLGSRKGYKSHLTQLYNKVDELLDKEVEEFSTALLTKAIHGAASEQER